MVKAIIVDDELKSRLTLQKMINIHCPGVVILELTDSVATAAVAIEQHQPDLVFLDIEMPFENGFMLFERIPKPDFKVIFTTAYDHYAIKAIKLSALDYLLKPVDADDLIAAVSKIHPQNHLQSKIEALLSNLKPKTNSAKIAVPTFNGLQMLNTGDIVKCKADESYTQISLANGSKLMVSRLLKEFEDLLTDLNFFRVHHSYLINLSHVVNYVKGNGGHVIMSDGESVEVSRRKKTELLGRLTRIPI